MNDKVVEIGDFLFGQRVSSLGRPHLNNRGDIAFSFNVLDPREPFGEWNGIALAVKESPLMGDYNGDGTVDAADYVVWRNGLGTAYTQADYDIWRAHFGETAGSDAALPSAEPRSAARASRRSAADIRDSGNVLPTRPNCFARTINSSARETHHEPTVLTRPGRWPFGPFRRSLYRRSKNHWSGRGWHSFGVPKSRPVSRTTRGAALDP